MRKGARARHLMTRVGTLGRGRRRGRLPQASGGLARGERIRRELTRGLRALWQARPPGRLGRAGPPGSRGAPRPAGARAPRRGAARRPRLPPGGQRPAPRHRARGGALRALDRAPLHPRTHRRPRGGVDHARRLITPYPRSEGHTIPHLTLLDYPFTSTHNRAKRCHSLDSARLAP